MTTLALVLAFVAGCSGPAPQAELPDFGPRELDAGELVDAPLELDAEPVDDAGDVDALELDAGELVDAPLELVDGASLPPCRGGEDGPVCLCPDPALGTAPCPGDRTCCDPIVDSGASPGLHCVLTSAVRAGFCEPW